MRDFKLTVDEPPEYGGENAGPMPTEMFLAALAGCFAAAMFHAAKKEKVELEKLAVVVRGNYDGLRFDKIVVEVQCPHRREQLEDIVERAIDYCYISNTLAQPPQLEYAIQET